MAGRRRLIDREGGDMDFWTIVIIFVIAIVAIGVGSAIHTSNKQKEIGVAIANIPGFSPSFQHLGADGDNGIAIDERQSKVCLFKRGNGALSHRVIDYRDVLSSEIFEDGHTVVKTVRSSQVGGALVGGVLLGGVGAVIGGLSGKKVESGKVNRIDLRLVVNDSTHPTHEVCFLSVESKRDGFLYKTSSEQARQWQARLDVLIKRADREDATNRVAAPKEVQSLSDELRKLAELRESGILTDAEFAAQKARLLG